MSELWVKWKHRLIFVACAWVLLAFIFLCASVEHSLFSAETASKIYRTISDIILLKWVTKYQTLLAGLAALAGGLGIIMATKISIRDNQERINKQKRDEVSSALLGMAAEYNRAQLTLHQGIPNKNMIAQINSHSFHLMNSIDELFHVNALAVEIISEQIDKRIFSISNSTPLSDYDTQDKNRAILLCSAMAILCEAQRKHINFEGWLPRMIKANGEPIIQKTKELGCEFSDIPLVSNFFYFSSTMAK